MVALYVFQDRLLLPSVPTVTDIRTEHHANRDIQPWYPGGGYAGYVITPDGRTVYVSSDGASTVSVIDTTTDAVRGSIEVGRTPHGLALTPDAKTVLVAAPR